MFMLYWLNFCFRQSVCQDLFSFVVYCISIFIKCSRYFYVMGMAICFGLVDKQ